MSSIAVFRRELVDPTAFIARTAVVVGHVTLAAEASVWFQAVLRGDFAAIRVGPRSNIQDGCVLNVDPGCDCVLGAGVTIGHLAIVHGAVIEDNVVVGMHAVVQNRARIGRDSIIGVGAVVTEGTVIPPGSLVLGLPGKVRRQLETEEIEGNRQAAAHYVGNARLFAAAAQAQWPPG